ncbi:hypothetical protein TWF481_007793 [Arthrobotrys musiformis]|uniref:GED domain-containing protein n=1 Tax=Arthrobotrys musiformis TaxID=47236 RepID=A0AAV9W6L6_9PEZI
MRAIVHDASGVDSDVSLNKPSSTESEEVAVAKIKALFPDISSPTDALPKIDELYESRPELIAGTHILETSSRAKVIDYMRSLVPSTINEETTLWPLVKVVKLYLDSDALKTGAILVDLPGLRDSNAARTAATRQYMAQANEIVVVTRLTRAATDETTVELSQAGYIKRLKHDGRRHLTIVCTCSDYFEPSDAAEDFKGDKQFLKKYTTLNNKIEAHYALVDSQSPKQQRPTREEITSLERNLQKLSIEARDKHAVQSISKTYSKLLKEDTSITCFVTSAKHYLENSSPRKRPGIMTTEESQIPMLRNYCALAPLEQKSALAVQFGQNINRIGSLAEVFGSKDSTGMSEAGKQKAKAEMDKAFTVLSSRLHNESLVFGTNIQNDAQFFLEGLSTAISRGEKHCLELHEKIAKEYKFQAVKSAYLHHGESATGKLKDLNEQFIAPLGAEVDVLWHTFMAKTEGHLHSWNLKVIGALDEFEVSWRNCIDENLESSPKGRDMSVKLLTDCLVPRIENAQAVAAEFCNRLKEDQRPVRRLFLFPDRLAELLRQGYQNAIEERGPGAFERMTKVFGAHIRKANVFGTLEKDIRKAVGSFQKQFGGMCHSWGEAATGDTETDIRSWLKANEEISREEAEYRAEIQHIVDKSQKPLMALIGLAESFQKKNANR